MNRRKVNNVREEAREVVYNGCDIASKREIGGNLVVFDKKN